MMSLRKLSMLKLAWLPLISIVVIPTWSAHAKPALKQMSDNELGYSRGQAIMNLSYIAPNDQANPMKNIEKGNIGFYKFGLDADVELNANIKNLQLGCGGNNGPGKCDIDIKNLSLSGLPDSYDAKGVPVFNEGRPSTSAKMTNPFMEFAIQNPNSSSTREVKGIRFSAEKMQGLLVTGLDNKSVPDPNDGIQMLSGFMQVSKTTGRAYTEKSTFGKDAGQEIAGYAHLCLGVIGNCALYDRDVYIVSQPKDGAGLSVPSMPTDFVLPAFSVNGQRLSTTTIEGIRTVIKKIPLATDGTAQYPAKMFEDDNLVMKIGCSGVTGGSGTLGCDGGIISLSSLKGAAPFKMAPGSHLQNLNMKINFEQDLGMIHNLPLVGSGGYLSLQNIALLWPGAVVSESDKANRSLDQMSRDTDVARPGWWMSFSEPVQLGKLEVAEQVKLESSVLEQVANRTSQSLHINNPEKPTAYARDLGKIIELLFNIPMSSKVVTDLGPYTSNNPVLMNIKNQKLVNQEVVQNCYGKLKFC